MDAIRGAEREGWKQSDALSAALEALQADLARLIEAHGAAGLEVDSDFIVGAGGEGAADAALGPPPLPVSDVF